MARFLLLLDDETDGRYAAGMEKRELAEQTSDSSGSHATKRLILELLMPKIEELAQVAESWQKRSGETYTPLSAERLQSLLSACVMGALLLPELVNTDTSASQDLEKALSSLCDNALKTVLDMAENEFYLNHMLMSLAPYIPAVSQTELVLLKQQNDPLLRIFAKVSSAVRGKDGNDSARLENDRMEVDEDFDTQGSLHTNSISRHHGLPRRDLYLNQTREAFYLETGILLHLLQITHEDNGAIGVVPDAIVNRLSELPAEQLLCCRSVMHNLFSSDLITTSDNAAKMIKAMGAIISQTDLSSCEASLCTCIEVMDSLISTWSDDVSDDAREVSDLVGDLYYYLVKKALPNNLLSPRTQIWLSKLLLRLLEVQPTYAEGLKLSSCRTTLLTILRKGNIEVQYHIGINLPKIFGLYVLKTHEDILVDILHSLPSDFECLEGIAYRVFVLAELACRWPTLLRRCIYHIFEVPGKFPDAAKHAETCFQRTANHLKLDSPRQIFKLFAPQLLYTWLDTESIQDIPFSIFGYADLSSLLRQARTEIAALMIMRGQEQAAVSLAQALEMDAQTMIREGFTKIIAYCFAHDINTAIKNGVSPGQTRVIRLMGEEAFHDHLHLHFADIVATFFTCFDQDGNIEDAFQKDPRFHHAAKNLEEMKSYGFLDTELPANQQPEFKARYLQKELEFLCNRSAFFELEGLWTPTMVVSIARKLLSTIHSVLGPLHACSVLRKLRVLVSIAGPQALSGYPLEMLLHSLRAFVVNAECADDALGMSRYLLQRAQEYLVKSPSFLAGYALSTMADLRIFLESTQSSTTQETQFKKTRDHAQGFHDWFEIYLKEYDSPHFKDAQQRDAFRAITISAGKIGRSGNAEKGTYESALLLEIWKDGERENQLLNAPAREVALSMLCGTFRVPASVRDDVVETDEQAISLNGVIWKSCSLRDLSQNYLSWAGRVLGRSFAASGEVSAELLSESRLEEYRKITTGDVGSEEGLLRLVEMLTVSSDCQTAGLAESALRVVVSHAVAVGDQILLDACQKSISNTILVSSNWVPYRAPPSDNVGPGPVYGNDVFAAKSLETPDWVKRLAIHLALSEPDVVTLSVLPPLLEQVNGFAEQAFPFVVHLVLDCQHDKQQEMKRHLSEALKEWLKSSAPSAKDNLKLLINTILYLRMQALPNEASIADRTHWLDVNFDTAASAATRCGMNKVALLFSELASSELSRASRRSSVARESEKASDVLLEIFENIDDPDAYYGLKQDASLATVLSRLEYENDGTKSLAFRGAQYDSHLRRGDAVSDQDGQALVKILCSLGLSGLSNSLLQVLQSSGTTPATLDSTFTTSRRLETWNLPASGRSESHAVTLYKAYQSMQKMGDVDAVRAAIHDGLSTTILQVTHGNLNASNLRQHLGSLAALTELDDLLHVADSAELQGVLSKFEARSKWMMSGRYSDVSQILSCRETTLSMITQHPDLRPPTLSPGDHRLAQIRGMLLSSDIFRFHRATQETLNLSTTLTHLVDLSESEGLSVGAAVSIDTANSLWDHGEMTDSIEMLKKVDRHSSLKKQSVAVSRSDLLSKIAHQVSVARLEPPDSIQKSYLEPALKELRGRSEGKEAGKVFHQFAMFCDQQLQDSDNLEDLARLQSLKRGKNDEVVQLKTLISNARDSQAKNRYQNHLNKAKQWLELDQQELRRVEQTRNEFVKLSLENYLLSLTASDEHNNDALRFTALWLERAEDATTNDAVQRSLAKVPTRKFAPLMNQLSSRLQDSRATFQNLLIRLVQSICLEHPYHGMYQVWSGAKTRPNREDEVAVSRQRANEKVAKVLAASKEKDIGKIWTSIDATNRAYHALALDRDANRYKTGQKMPIKDSSAGPNFLRDLARYPIPPPTMQVKLSPEKDYSKVPLIVKFEPNMCIASGVSAPKIITARGSDGKSYKQLVKGGNDDLRQDAIMEQAFAAVSELLRLHRTTRQRNLGIRTYKVLPLTSSSGLIEFVQDTIPLHEYLMPAHERYYPRDFKGSQCRKEISNAQTKTAETRVSTYRKVTDKFHPVMRYFFMEYFPDPDEWFARRTAYTRTTAAISMLGHVLGLGDRHGHNILLDSKTGEVVHIDLGVAFEMGRVLPVPELVPFRLTRDIVDGMGITKTEGVFRRCCEFTLDALREETYSIMTILDVLRYDPLYTWSISPVRMAKLQHARAGAADDGGGGDVDDQGPEMGGGRSGNEPSEADRALEVVRKKLSKTLSVTATVNDLINQATDERNLAMLYSGGFPFFPLFAVSLIPPLDES